MIAVYSGHLSSWSCSFSPPAWMHVPRKLSAAGCWEQKLCDASKPVQEMRGHSVGAHYQLSHWMWVGVLVGFVIMASL